MGLAQDAKNELHTLITTLEADGHALATRFRNAFDTLKAELPALADEAEQDAADVADTAANQGLVAAEHEAVTDAGQLATDAGHDVVTAVETPDPAPEPTA